AGAGRARRARTWRGRRRPCASSWPCALLSRLLAGGEPLAHRVGQVFVRLRDAQLFHRIARFRIGGERLAQLLRAAEASTEREVLSEREALTVLLPHQDAPQVGMALEADAEHVEALALDPIRALVDRPHARHRE